MKTSAAMMAEGQLVLNAPFLIEGFEKIQDYKDRSHAGQVVV